ncbi:Serine-threonine protein kinase [Entamoeba marina]
MHIILCLVLFSHSFSQICGDGILSVLNEECDGVEHCTDDCLCEEGYSPIRGENICEPICLIDGCSVGCVSPNECLICNNIGYLDDCHSCDDGYFSNGYLHCQEIDNYDVKTCAEMINNSNIEINDNYVTTTIQINPKQWELTPVQCSPISLKDTPYLLGEWFSLTMDFDGYIAIETDKHYTITEINYNELNEIPTGNETVLTIQKSCSNNISIADECLFSNINVAHYIYSSRIICPTIKQLYLFVHSTVDNFTTTFDLHIKRIVHPCSYTYEEISWNDLARFGFTTTISSIDCVLSDSACVKQSQLGKWFHLYGAKRTVIMETSNSENEYSTSIHLIETDLVEDYSNSTCGISNNSQCVSYSYGCTEEKCGPNYKINTKMFTLSANKTYFIFVSFQTTRISTVDFSISIACPFNCNSHGICTEDGCLCHSGYTNKGGTCSTCGNGVLDEGEQCDLSANNYLINDLRCDENTCMCLYGNVPITINNITKCAPPTCGNGKVDDYEECDGGIGCSFCYCEEGYVSYVTPRKGCLSDKCGNGRLDKNEECDGGKHCFECECDDGYYPIGELRCGVVSVLFTRCVGGIFFYVSYFFTWCCIFSVVWLRYHFLEKEIKKEQQKLENFLPFITKTIIKFDKRNTHFIDVTLDNPYFSFTSSNIDFGVDVVINQPNKTQIFLTNKHKDSLKFTFHGRETFKYDLMFVPVTGSIHNGQTIEITAIIVIKCTTVLTEKIPVTISFRHLNESFANFVDSDQTTSSHTEMSKQKKNIKKSRKKFHLYLTLLAESELSNYIDYDSLDISYPAIGGGTFANVFKAVWRSTDVAVKILKTGIMEMDNLRDCFTKELEVMEKTHHPCIIKLIGSSVTESNLCLVMEYFPLGNVREFYKQNKMEDFLKARMIENISSAMEYLHSKQIMHYDLKPDNVLVVSSNPNEQVVCKISDFGTAQAFVHLPTNSLKNIGTPIYMAPEVYKNGTPSFKSDVFSFALCVLEICKSNDIYTENEFPGPTDVFNFINSGQRPKIPDGCMFKDIIQSCWCTNPHDRLTFKEVSSKVSSIVKYIQLSHWQNDSIYIEKKSSSPANLKITDKNSKIVVNQHYNITPRSSFITSDKNK